MSDFQWDQGNLRHIAFHNVSQTEAEAAVTDAKRLSVPAYAHRGEVRVGIIGATDAGRILFEVFTYRHSLIRIATSHDAKRPQRRAYRSQS